MRRWPDTLPQTTSEGFRLVPVDQSIRTDMEVGAQRVRRRTRSRLYRVGMGFVLNDAQMALFSDWFDDRQVSICGASDSIAGWGVANTTIQLAQSLAPDLVAADRLVETAADGMHFAEKVLADAAVNDLPLALTVTLRAAGRSRARLMLVDRAGAQHAVNADLTAGTILGTNGAPLAMSIKDRGDGWYRLALQASTGVGAGQPAMRIGLLGPASEVSYAGTAGLGCDVCEVQARVRTGFDLFCPCDADGMALGAAGGSAWFRVPLATGGGLTTGEAKFAAMWEAQAAAGLKWQVTGQMEVRNA